MFLNRAQFNRTLQALLICVFALNSLPSVASNDPVYQGLGFQLDCARAQIATEANLAGPQYFLKAIKNPKSKKIQDITEGRILSYNVLNLVESPGRWVKNEKGVSEFIYGKLLKPEHQTRGIMRTIERENPLIATLVEVESMHALASLDQNYPFMRNYAKILVEGNDARGIDIAFLVSKDLYANIKVESHKYLTHVYLGAVEKVMSRDFPVLLFFDPDAPEGSAPVLIYAGVHLKSQRAANEPGEISPDPGSELKRSEQIKTMIEILDGYRKKYPRTPVIFTGDFNKNIPTGKEFTPLNTGYPSAFDVFKVSSQSIDRTTQAYFPRDGAPIYSQLDDARVDENTAQSGAMISIETVADRDQAGNKLGVPLDYREREKRDSDHRAIKLVLNFKLLLQKAKSWVLN